MNAFKHMLIVVGARPQFIKAAALHRALVDVGGWRSTWLHTGQHHDEALSGQFFQELGLPEPDVRLTPNPASRELRLGDMMEGIRTAIDAHRPNGWWCLATRIPRSPGRGQPRPSTFP